MSLRIKLITKLGGAHPEYVRLAEDSVEKLTLANKKLQDRLEFQNQIRNTLLNKVCDNELSFDEESIVDWEISQHQAGRV